MSKEYEFRTAIGRHIFHNKYALNRNETWAQRCYSVVSDVCGTGNGRYKNVLLDRESRRRLAELMIQFKWLPGGRYIYYGGRESQFFNNCFLLKAEEDTREEWAKIAQHSTSALMSGGGIGIDYSMLRGAGMPLKSTGGLSSGPLPLMKMVNEIGRNVMQGGSRRSAMYASLNHQHHDIRDFLKMKDWHNHTIVDGVSVKDAKEKDANFNAVLDMTNISINYDTEWLEGDRMSDIFLENVRQACMTGDPGFSFNFYEKENETLRNACAEVTSEDDSDVCNLASLNMANIESIDEFREVTELVSKFLVCGTIRAHLPYDKVAQVRDKNRRLGLGLMGVHEWLLQRGYKYEANEELGEWLEVYEKRSEVSANEHCDRLYLNRPVAYRSIAPTGSIGMLAGTTTGIEPLYAVAYKRRYLTEGTKWNYELVVDGTADQLIQEGISPDSIETSLDLAADPARRLAFQSFVQGYVDMSISSTINLPSWGSDLNNEDTVQGMATTLAKYAPSIRGFTCYPDGSRGGQPLTSIPYEEAKGHAGTIFEEHDVCDITGKGGSCGV